MTTPTISEEALKQWIKKTARAARYIMPTESVVQVTELRELFKGRRLVQADEDPDLLEKLKSLRRAFDDLRACWDDAISKLPPSSQPTHVKTYADGLRRAVEICKTKTWADDCAEAIEQEAKQ